MLASSLEMSTACLLVSALPRGVSHNRELVANFGKIHKDQILDWQKLFRAKLGKILHS